MNNRNEAWAGDEVGDDELDGLFDVLANAVPEGASASGVELCLSSRDLIDDDDDEPTLVRSNTRSVPTSLADAFAAVTPLPLPSSSGRLALPALRPRRVRTVPPPPCGLRSVLPPRPSSGVSSAPPTLPSAAVAQVIQASPSPAPLPRQPMLRREWAHPLAGVLFGVGAYLVSMVLFSSRLLAAEPPISPVPAPSVETPSQAAAAPTPASTEPAGPAPDQKVASLPTGAAPPRAPAAPAAVQCAPARPAPSHAAALAACFAAVSLPASSAPKASGRLFGTED